MNILIHIFETSLLLKCVENIIEKALKVIYFIHQLLNLSYTTHPISS